MLVGEGAEGGRGASETGELAFQVSALVLQKCGILADRNEAHNLRLNHLNLLLPDFYFLP
jgi:hypothetical protein